ncbi:MAG: hypothetical protein V8R10_00080 [Christensenellales bacterium]
MTNREKTDMIQESGEGGEKMNEGVWYFIGAVVLLVINYCMASKAGEIANDKGYDENLWKWSCFFFAIAYILVAAMPDLKERDILKEISKNLGQNKGLKNDGDAGQQDLTTPASELRTNVERSQFRNTGFASGVASQIQRKRTTASNAAITNGD